MNDEGRMRDYILKKFHYEGKNESGVTDCVQSTYHLRTSYLLSYLILHTNYVHSNIICTL